MKRYRVLMMLGGLLATAGTVHAQATTTQPTYPAPSTAFPLPAQLKSLEDGVKEAYAQVPTECWYLKALQESAAAWQRVRVMCTTNSKEAGCFALGMNGGGCALGIMGGILSCETVQKACCCAKARACCETCKDKKSAAAKLPTVTPEMMRRLAGLQGIVVAQPCPLTQTCPAAPAIMPPSVGKGIVQIIPVEGGQVIQVMQVVHHVKPAHLVTPDLEAHCERMQNVGDTMVLEGNVLLLCKKFAQPIRIEAERVVVNMRTGTFAVESTTRVTPAAHFGIQRTSAVEMAPACNVGCTIPVPASRVVPAAATTPTSALRFSIPATLPGQPATTDANAMLQFWIPLTR